MQTLSLVDPEQREAVATFPPFDPARQDIAEFRQMVDDGLTALLSPVPVAHEEHFVPAEGTRPRLRVLVFRPDAASKDLPSIVYAHGGGMIAGTADMMAGAHAALAKRTGTVIVSVDYRLAPEAPFPAGLEDVYAALMWTRDKAGQLGVDPGRISLMGDSGGGCLAAAATLVARDRTGPAIRAQFLVYPMLDSRTATAASPHQNDPTTGEFNWTRAQNVHAWRNVEAGIAISKDKIGWFSPAQAARQDGLPPAFIIVGTLDLFRDEDIDYARRLSTAGVPAELHVYPGAIHGFDLLGDSLAIRAQTDLADAIRRLG